MQKTGKALLDFRWEGETQEGFLRGDGEEEGEAEALRVESEAGKEGHVNREG